MRIDNAATAIPLSAQRSASGAANAANHKALRQVRALVIDVRKNGGANGLTESKEDPGKSEALAEEPFNALGHKGRIIMPPFDMLTLAMLPENSSEMFQCVEAMEMNIEATGHRFVSRLRLDDVTKIEDDQASDTKGDLTPEQRKALDGARAEKVRLTNFFTYCTTESFVQFRRRLRKDLETTGNAYYEVIRNAAGEVQGFTHLPSYQMRLGKMEDEAVEVTRKILELQPDGSVVVKEQRVMRRFRTFVQSRTIQQGRTTSSITGHKVVWFKEFGDPRAYSKSSGEHDGEGGERKRIDLKDRASEVLHLKLYSPRSPYGLPRFIGNLLSIFGDRAAEEINWITFKNNNIPSMVVAVSNGQLTQGTVDRIESFVESQIQGSDNYSKFLIIEAEPTGEDTAGEDGGQVKIDVKPLTKEQHADALFQNYSTNNQDKIRRSFRLPPIFVGRAGDYTRSTAESSRRLADEQVFAPERMEFDEMMNRLIFPEMGVIFHKFKSNTPNTTDNTQLVKILGGSEKTGGMTPRIARFLLEDILGADLPNFAADFPADVPFSMTMAEAVKNQAQPTEPGQQVTALKALGLIDDNDELDLSSLGLEDLDENDPESVIEVAKRLLALNRSAEIIWRKRMTESA
jgi:PBSX family phage portal protein